MLNFSFWKRLAASPPPPSFFQFLLLAETFFWLLCSVVKCRSYLLILRYSQSVRNVVNLCQPTPHRIACPQRLSFKLPIGRDLTAYSFRSLCRNSGRRAKFETFRLWRVFRFVCLFFFSKVRYAGIEETSSWKYSNCIVIFIIYIVLSISPQSVMVE